MLNLLDSFKENPQCLYIYTGDFSIYNIEDSPKYIVVVKDEWVVPEDWIGFNVKEQFTKYQTLKQSDTTYNIYKISDWFQMILNGDLICWECACINKKFIIKEHVKLLMKTDPLQLRKEIQAKLDPYVFYAQSEADKGNIDKAQKLFWETIKDIKFVNQIIESHKIVNFKEAYEDWVKLKECYDTDNLLRCWADLVSKPFKLLKDRTDGLLKAEKIKKIIQDE